MKIKLGNVEAGGNTGKLIITAFTPGSTDVRTNYVDRPNGDGQMVGTDYLGASTWAFDIATNTKTLKEAATEVASFEGEWKKPSTRLTSNVPVALKYTHGGSWYKVYGRPGKFTGFTPNVHATLGVGLITCDFTQTNPLHFADVENKEILNIIPATTGGFKAPLIAPLTTRKSSAERAGFVDNLGNAATPLKIKFIGPAKNPKIRSAKGWEIGYVGTLAYDQHVIIDPLMGTVLLYTGVSSGVNVAGRLTVRTRLSAVTLPVGRSEFFFSGEDVTGTAKAELMWNNAYTSMQV